MTRVFVKPVPGWHGKGAYTGQGRLVVSNNGDSPADGDLRSMMRESDPKTWSKEPEDTGVLAEWDGKTWNIVQRRQFTDVTGPAASKGTPMIMRLCGQLGWTNFGNLGCVLRARLELLPSAQSEPHV